MSPKTLEAANAVISFYQRPDGTTALNEAQLLAEIFRLRAELAQTQKALSHQTELARTDTLTGIPNRRALLEHLKAALEEEKSGVRVSESAPFAENRKADVVGVAIGFIDLDGFKQINDTYGHEAGDAILKEVARFLSETLRDTDTVGLYEIPEEKTEMAGRLGGDEFVLVLRHTDSEQLAKRRACMEATLNMLSVEIEHQGQTVKIPIKGTLGLIDCDLSKTAHENLDKADQAMYDLKSAKKSKAESDLAQQRFAIMMGQLSPSAP